jgi:hypothetical protein
MQAGRWSRLDMTMAASLADRPIGPALQRLLTDVVAHRIHIIVVHEVEVDRLTRSLADQTGRTGSHT